MRRPQWTVARIRRTRTTQWIWNQNGHAGGGARGRVRPSHTCRVLAEFTLLCWGGLPSPCPISVLGQSELAQACPSLLGLVKARTVAQATCRVLAAFTTPCWSGSPSPCVQTCRRTRQDFLPPSWT
eukprot:gene19669-biopygen10055